MTDTGIALLGIASAVILLNLLSALYRRQLFLRKKAMRQRFRANHHRPSEVPPADVSQKNLSESPP